MKKVTVSLIFLVMTQAGFLYGSVKGLNSFLVKKSLYQEFEKPEHIRILKKRGSYTLASMFRDRGEVDWAKKFDIVELGGVDDIHITKQVLKDRDIFSIGRRIGYDWMPAFYYYTSGKNRKFVDWLYANRDKTLLNPDGPFLHCQKNGYDWCKDYYYNFGDKEVLDSRVNHLVKNMKEKGFNGLFFDWASGGFILSKEYQEMKKRFEKLNPNKNYFKMVGKFYKALKDKGVFVVTNQAFRKEKYFLKYVTYDMTESYITTQRVKEMKIQIAGRGWVDSVRVTNYYPIYKNSNSIKDSLHFIDLLTSYKKKYKKFGFKNFIYLNYLAPKYEKVYDSAPLYRAKKPKNAIYFGYTMAKLTNNIVYGEISHDRDMERDDVYFFDLGKPLGDSYMGLDALDAYVRYYINGFVIASSAYDKDRYIELISKYIPKGRYVYGAYDNTWLKSGKNSLIIKLHFEQESFTQKFSPTGRVFLYNQN